MPNGDIYNYHWNEPLYKGRVPKYYSVFETPQKALTKEEDTMPQYILWSPSGHSNPVVRFDSFKAAQGVAESMALTHKQEFFVCKLMSSTIPAPKTITTHLDKLEYEADSKRINDTF
jgi:hypothetical protein